MLRLVLLAALLCGAFANSADESEEVFAGNLNCQGTGRLPEEVGAFVHIASSVMLFAPRRCSALAPSLLTRPALLLGRQPRALSFCYKFNDQACCAPAVDDEIAEFFTILTGECNVAEEAGIQNGGAWPHGKAAARQGGHSAVSLCLAFPRSSPSPLC